MPGFKIGGRGNGPSSTNEMRRTHRWTFAVISPETRDINVLLKTASRPSFTFDKPEVHHNQEKIYYAGKQTWEPVTLTWYDAEQPVDVSERLWTWLNSVSNIPTANVSHPRDFKGDGDLRMLDGQGVTTEQWILYNGWPESVNWQALDYSSSEVQLIEVKYAYDRAERI